MLHFWTLAVAAHLGACSVHGVETVQTRDAGDAIVFGEELEDAASGVESTISSTSGFAAADSAQIIADSSSSDAAAVLLVDAMADSARGQQPSSDAGEPPPATLPPDAHASRESPVPGLPACSSPLVALDPVGGGVCQSTYSGTRYGCKVGCVDYYTVDPLPRDEQLPCATIGKDKWSTKDPFVGVTVCLKSSADCNKYCK